MQITGHRTRAVFDRYNIVSSEDLRKATEKLDNYELTTFGPKSQNQVVGQIEGLIASA